MKKKKTDVILWGFLCLQILILVHQSKAGKTIATDAKTDVLFEQIKRSGLHFSLFAKEAIEKKVYVELNSYKMLILTAKEFYFETERNAVTKIHGLPPKIWEKVLK